MWWGPLGENWKQYVGSNSGLRHSYCCWLWWSLLLTFGRQQPIISIAIIVFHFDIISATAAITVSTPRRSYDRATVKRFWNSLKMWKRPDIRNSKNKIKSHSVYIICVFQVLEACLCLKPWTKSQWRNDDLKQGCELQVLLSSWVKKIQLHKCKHTWI